MPENKIAIITGAASGMGLEVARLLANQDNTTTTTPKWTLHLFDLNETDGAAAAAQLGPHATFHKVDISSYASLSAGFETVFRSSGRRLDFVYANAGIFEKADFWAVHDSGDYSSSSSSSSPPELGWGVIDVNVKGTMNTCYLAQHYFRLANANANGGGGGGGGGKPEGGSEKQKNHHHHQQEKCLVVTASCTALYPSEHTPRYSAAKAALLNFVRAIAPTMYSRYGVRCSAVLPGAVLTNFLPSGDWPPSYKEEHFTKVGLVAEAVAKLLKGDEVMVDAWGNEKRPGKEQNGLAVEVGAGKIYFREVEPFCDEVMAAVMGGVTVEAREKK